MRPCCRFRPSVGVTTFGDRGSTAAAYGALIDVQLAHQWPRPPWDQAPDVSRGSAPRQRIDRLITVRLSLTRRPRRSIRGVGRPARHFGQRMAFQRGSVDASSVRSCCRGLSDGRAARPASLGPRRFSFSRSLRLSRPGRGLCSHSFSAERCRVATTTGGGDIVPGHRR